MCDHIEPAKRDAQAWTALPTAPSGRWRHHKGGLYDVVALGCDPDTLFAIVVARSVETGWTWTYPLTGWLDRFTPEPAETSLVARPSKTQIRLSLTVHVEEDTGAKRREGTVCLAVDATPEADVPCMVFYTASHAFTLRGDDFRQTVLGPGAMPAQAGAAPGGGG